MCHDAKLNLRYMKSLVNKKAPCLILIHGLTEDSSCFKAVKSTDLAKSYNIISVELPGFGESKSRIAIAVKDLVIAHQNIVALIEKYSKTQSVIVLGHSLGGLIGTLVCSALKDKVSLFLNVDGLLQEMKPGSSSFANAGCFHSPEKFKQSMLKSLQSQSGATNHYIARYINNVKATDAETLHAWAKAIIEMLKDNAVFKTYTQLKCKAIYLYGERSINKKNNLLVKKENLDRTEFTGLGHWPMLESPEVFWKAVASKIHSHAPIKSTSTSIATDQPRPRW